MLKSNPIYIDINGAPCKILNKVVILNNPNMDKTFNEAYVSEIGEVVYFEYECGCGQSYPNDPMIGIKFANEKIEEYWIEELKII